MIMTRQSFHSDLDAYSVRAQSRPAKKSAAEILGYTAAAGGLAFAGGDAMGAIVYNAAGFTSHISGSSASAIVNIDIDGVGNGDLGFFFKIESSYSFSAANLGSTSVFSSPGQVVATSPNRLADVIKPAPGFLVGSTLAYGAFGLDEVRVLGRSNGLFYLGTTGYIGFRFVGDTGAVGIQYGWAKLRFDASPGDLTLNLLEWAYDDSGAPIAVGDTGGGGGASVPAPDTAALALLGLGAMGVRGYRRRRDQGLRKQRDGQAATA